MNMGMIASNTTKAAPENIGQVIRELLASAVGTVVKFQDVTLLRRQASTYDTLILYFVSRVRKDVPGLGARLLTGEEQRAILREYPSDARAASSVRLASAPTLPFLNAVVEGPASAPPPALLPVGVPTYTLLLWEEIPEGTKLVLIPNSRLTTEDYALLRAVHGRHLNGRNCSVDQTILLQKWSDALCHRREDLSADNPVGSLWAMRFADCVVDDGTHRANPPPFPENKIITQVYRCGWFL